MNAKLISTPNAPAAIGPYSQALDLGNVVYCSGQIPIVPATGELAEGLQAQAEQVFANIEAVLAAAATVPGLTDLRVTAEKGGEVSFTAVSESGADLRGALSLALAKADCPVLNLSAESMSLEDVFLQLTENQETNEEEAE